MPDALPGEGPFLVFLLHRPGRYPAAWRAAINPYLAQFTFTFLQMLTWAVIARSLLSWFPIDQGSALYQMLFRVTEPIIEPLRRVIPNAGMIDLSPLAAIFLLMLLGQAVIGLAAPA